MTNQGEDLSKVDGVEVVLESVRRIVRGKTRFGREHILMESGEDFVQPFEIVASHGLKSRLEKQAISGHFRPIEADPRCASAEEAARGAAGDADARLGLAESKLRESLASASTSYDAISDGVYLPRSRAHWFLDTCASCNGKRVLQCEPCSGVGNIRCPHCKGTESVKCPGCNGRRAYSCSFCGGRGGRMVFYVSNGSPAQRYEYCSSCANGQVTCAVCGGNGNVRCTKCANGRVTCVGCSGEGKVKCAPCVGSGEAGVGAWIDVHETCTYELHLPLGAQRVASQVLEQIDTPGFAKAARTIAFGEVHSKAGDGLAVLTAKYRGDLRLVRLALKCNARRYDLGAYGEDLQVLSLGTMVEDLLTDDLGALQEALVQVADDGLAATDIGGLLASLKAVVDSEVNAEIVKAALENRDEPKQGDIVSKEYAGNVKSAILAALQNIYLRKAKMAWWKIVAASTGTMVLGWAILGGVWGIRGGFWGLMLGALVVAAGYYWFAWDVKKSIVRAIDDPAKAELAVRISAKGKRNALGNWFVMAPAVAALLLVGYLLPSRELIRHGHPPQAAPSANAGATAPDVKPGPASVPTALELYRKRDFVGARSMLARLANTQDPGAAGAFGWMVMLGEGLPPGNRPTDAELLARHAEAKPWIENGLLVGDVWGVAGKGVMLVEGWTERRDTARGMKLLLQAASSGHAPSAHYLGMIYVNGINVKVDNVKARKWFKIAADSGWRESVYNLGYMDWHGLGIKRPDHQSAIGYWKKAAQMGEKRAIEAVARQRPYGE